MKKYFDGYFIAFLIIGLGIFLLIYAPTFVQYAETSEQSANQAIEIAMSKAKDDPKSVEYLKLVEATELASANFYRSLVRAIEWLAVFLLIIGASQIRFVFKLHKKN
jgi:flavin-binding protein dodecin